MRACRRTSSAQDGPAQDEPPGSILDLAGRHKLIDIVDAVARHKTTNFRGRRILLEALLTARGPDVELKAAMAATPGTPMVRKAARTAKQMELLG